MLQKEIRLRAAHLFNGMALLFERGCKLPVAGLTFLHALDQRRSAALSSLRSPSLKTAPVR